ncbi:N-acetylmuramoyl-L-alanine amidase [Bradyrhizobium cenepequi]|uniref:N-acetylmuramoyl-L-alanine amidase n=1 Tax=Bradyrhizobium cenepequi TaxID=2821403 RepID=UPI001CE350CB|nr:N-acetylmuramoyl-L-alanine amidase [Bradyrhizobium cenepequi]
MEEYLKYSPDIANILASFAERETRHFYIQLRRGLVRTLSEHVLMLRNPKRRANVAVLRSFDAPSVLVEMGFMSNAADDALAVGPSSRPPFAQALRPAWVV